ncbi:hypothetical protein [Desulfuromonas thiophila]|uniref:Uncharacterized protein n=1 Tax=Desulfuromonas thiophila TaxID=57664 RepID=A0A1G7B3N4_9BACT|nr:hypothetical protein [Desulfuromonas thiophila]SDE21724.1 hypothetical protein SAMN05661003_10552 [Desulfuromonas thiophila]
MKANIKLFRDGDQMVGKFPASRAGLNAALRVLRCQPAAMIVEATDGECFAPLFVDPITVRDLPPEFLTAPAPAIYAELAGLHHRTVVSYEHLWAAEEQQRVQRSTRAH